MLGNLHVRFGVGAGAKFPGLHHIIEDRHVGPSDVVRVRLDFSDWLKTLSHRDRRVANFLALGNRTTDAARKFGVCQGRISQIRNEPSESWKEFTGDEPRPEAA